jgi:hypothetical protein
MDRGLFWLTSSLTAGVVVIRAVNEGSRGRAFQMRYCRGKPETGNASCRNEARTVTYLTRTRTRHHARLLPPRRSHGGGLHQRTNHLLECPSQRHVLLNRRTPAVQLLPNVPQHLRFLHGRAHQLPSRMWHMPAPLLGDVLLRLRRRLRRRRPRLRVWHHLPVRHRLHRLRPALAALALAPCPPGADHSVHGDLRAPHDMGPRWFVRRRWSGRRVRKLRAR